MVEAPRLRLKRCRSEMSHMDQPESVFHVHAALRKSKGVWAENEILFLGQLTVGSLSIGDTIRLPLIGGGYVNAKVASEGE